MACGRWWVFLVSLYIGVFSFHLFYVAQISAVLLCLCVVGFLGSAVVRWFCGWRCLVSVGCGYLGGFGVWFLCRLLCLMMFAFDLVGVLVDLVADCARVWRVAWLRSGV